MDKCIMYVIFSVHAISRLLLTCVLQTLITCTLVTVAWQALCYGPHKMAHVKESSSIVLYPLVSTDVKATR